ncbi:hypothetical protein DT603_03505 [Pseudoxanthomonas gei]|uniref:FAD-binding domain-containing protein n=1 Tax=Pseudoxanthomonas gei TaxID=1383030 RepID=A0ABX0A8P1_9GAMM|nr:hypothetical protein [Pseudoxanthomonas gei]
MDTEVLIVGAGPTGLMLANQLARRGVHSLLIDRHAQPARETRALGVQARTLEIYAQLGVVERALALGKRATGAQLWTQGRKAARVPLIDAGSLLTPYPCILVLGQDDNERILGDRLADWDQPVHWNTSLQSLQQRDGHVTATLAVAAGAVREVRARWVAGCDGSHSTVRALNGIPFEGAPYEHVFYVADVQASGSMAPAQVNVFLWKQTFHLLFPLRGDDHWRIVGILPPALAGRDDVDFDAVLPSLRGETGLHIAVDRCSWFSTYRIHHRRAARFRAGRCFLLGDAAHIHSPVGAQGMNTGLQDAYNLAWKLALVVNRQARESLLHSYEDERIPVATRLLDTTDRAFRLVVSAHPLAALLRTQVLARVVALAMRNRRLQELAFRTVSQIGIHYRDSALSVSDPRLPARSVQAGDRFPWLRLVLQPGEPAQDLFQALEDTHFHLLLFGQLPPPALSGFNGLLRTHVVPDDARNHGELERAGIPAVSFFLLRPDGHVGLCGSRAEAAELAAYAEARLGLRTMA